MKNEKTIYLFENTTTNEKGHKIINFIKITQKTIKEYFKFENSNNIVCVGEHYLTNFYKNVSNLDNLKQLLIDNHKIITLNEIKNF